MVVGGAVIDDIVQHSIDDTWGGIPRAVHVFGNYMIFMAVDGVYIFDGANPGEGIYQNT